MRYNVIIIIMTYCVFSSCVRNINLDLREESPVGVFCVLADSSIQTLRLFYAKADSNSDPEPVSGANIELFERDDKVGSFYEEKPGYYLLAFSPKYGHHYDLIVKTGRTVLTAKTEMPEDLTLRCTWITKHGISSSFEIVNSQEELSKTPCKIFLQAYTSSEGNTYPCNLIYTSLSGVLPLNTTTILYDREAIVESYYKQTGLREWSGRFLSPGYYHSKYLMIHYPGDYSNGIKEEELERYGLCSSSAFFLEAASDHLSSPTKIYYVIHFLSDSYADYLYSVYYKEQNRGDILSALYDQTNFSSNVTGGFGLFGAVVRREVYHHNDLKY